MSRAWWLAAKHRNPSVHGGKHGRCQGAIAAERKAPAILFLAGIDDRQGRGRRGLEDSIGAACAGPLPSEPPDSSRPRSRCPEMPSAPSVSMGEEHRLERLFHPAASACNTRHRWFRRDSKGVVGSGINPVVRGHSMPKEEEGRR